MTEQPEAKQEQPEEARPDLHPMYQPAEKDSRLVIHFIGNTPVIAGYDAINITPYHMLGAAEDMKRKAFQMIQYAEVMEAEEQKKRNAMGIQTATKIPAGPLPPDGGFKHGG